MATTAKAKAAAYDALLADRDRLARRVEELEAVCRTVLNGFRYEKGRPIMLEWKIQEVLRAALAGGEAARE